jgi:hypothetical protein
MINSTQYYHGIVENFINQDLVSCNYDGFQHDVNLYCYLKELYNNVKSEFDIATDDISALGYLNSMLNEVQKRLYYHSKIRGQIN